MKPIVWKDRQERYGGPVTQCYVGEVVVAWCHRDTLRSREEPERYKWHVALPGYPRPDGHAPTLDAAKKRITGMVEFWFRKME